MLRTVLIWNQLIPHVDFLKFHVERNQVPKR